MPPPRHARCLLAAQHHHVAGAPASAAPRVASRGPRCRVVHLGPSRSSRPRVAAEPGDRRQRAGGGCEGDPCDIEGDEEATDVELLRDGEHDREWPKSADEP